MVRGEKEGGDEVAAAWGMMVGEGMCCAGSGEGGRVGRTDGKGRGKTDHGGSVGGWGRTL